MGANDYLVMPLDVYELLARLNALQRRPPLGGDLVLPSGDVVLDPSLKQVKETGRIVPLTAAELALLELFLYRSPSVIPRQTIAAQVWDVEAEVVGPNTIDVFAGRLRATFLKGHTRIETVPGSRYRLVAV